MQSIGFDLFVDLSATDEQADFPVVYTRALEGRAGLEPDQISDNFEPLFDAIVGHLPPPMIVVDGPPQLLVTTLEHSSYVGKIAIGRLSSGSLSAGQAIIHINTKGEMSPETGRHCTF